MKPIVTLAALAAIGTLIIVVWAYFLRQSVNHKRPDPVIGEDPNLPSARRGEVKQSGDDEVLEQLRKAGDDLTKPRRVDHYFYFRSSGARSGLARQLQTEGYDLSDQYDRAPGQRRFSLRMSQVQSVQPDCVKRTTSHLEELAARFDGEYDGWETSVER